MAGFTLATHLELEDRLLHYFSVKEHHFVLIIHHSFHINNSNCSRSFIYSQWRVMFNLIPLMGYIYKKICQWKLLGLGNINVVANTLFIPTEKLSRFHLLPFH